MTFALIATIIALAAGVAVAVTLVAIVAWSDRRRAGLPAMTGREPSLSLEVAAWANFAALFVTMTDAAPWWLLVGTMGVVIVVLVLDSIQRAPLPSFVLAVALGLAVFAWAWTAPIWVPGAVYAIGVGWWIVGLVAELRTVRRTEADVPVVVAGLIGAALWPIVAVGREVRRRREVAS